MMHEPASPRDHLVGRRAGTKISDPHAQLSCVLNNWDGLSKCQNGHTILLQSLLGAGFPHPLKQQKRSQYWGIRGRGIRGLRRCEVVPGPATCASFFSFLRFSFCSLSSFSNVEPLPTLDFAALVSATYCPQLNFCNQGQILHQTWHTDYQEYLFG